MQGPGSAKFRQVGFRGRVGGGDQCGGGSVRAGLELELELGLGLGPLIAPFVVRHLEGEG